MKKKRTLFLVSYIMLVLLLVFDLLMMLFIIGMKETGKSTGNVVFDPNATDKWQGSELGTTQGVTVAGFSSLTIPPNMQTVAIHLYNPIENLGLFYMTFELRLLDGSEQGYEVLYKSDGYVAPGFHIPQVTLSHGLPAGVYKAQLLIQPYRMSDLTPTNNVVAKVELTVK